MHSHRVPVTTTAANNQVFVLQRYTGGFEVIVIFQQNNHLVRANFNSYGSGATTMIRLGDAQAFNASLSVRAMIRPVLPTLEI